MEKKSLTELREIAKEKGITNISKLKKDELVELLKKEETKKVEDITQNDKTYKVTNEDDEIVEGILEVLPDGYGFLRGDNYLSTPKDVYVSPIQIKRFKLLTGDKIKGIARTPKEGEKFPALIFVGEVNDESPDTCIRRKNFSDLIPIHPEERLRLETTQNEVAMRMIDLMSPIGKGQRGMIVAPPKVGKTKAAKILKRKITEMAWAISSSSASITGAVAAIAEPPQIEEPTPIKVAVFEGIFKILYKT